MERLILDAGKEIRPEHMSSKLNNDGSRKKIQDSSWNRKQKFIQIEKDASIDCIYKAGVEAALVWKLKVVKDVTEISLGDNPEESSRIMCRYSHNNYRLLLVNSNEASNRLIMLFGDWNSKK